MTEYQELIRRVFSNQAGEELMDRWREMFGDRRSYFPNQRPEDTAFMEGERAFYLHIKEMLRHE